MAKQGIVSTAQDTVVGAAKTGAEGVRTLAGSLASTAAKAASGAALSAVKGARRLVRGKAATRKAAKRRSSRPVARKK